MPARKAQNSVGIAREPAQWRVTAVGVRSGDRMVAELPEDDWWTPKRVEKLAAALQRAAF